MDGDYMCPACRRNPLVSDAMIGGIVIGSSSSLSASPSTIADNECQATDDDMIVGISSTNVVSSSRHHVFANDTSPLGIGTMNNSELLADQSTIFDMFPISSASTTTSCSGHASPSSIALECRVPNAPPPRVKLGADGSAICKKKPGRQPGAVRTSRYAQFYYISKI